VNVSEKDLQELSSFMQKTGYDIWDEYYSGGSDILAILGLFSEFESQGPIPLEVWTGIVQAIADASGYRIILQAAIVEPIEDNPDMMRVVTQREIATVEPTLFGKEG
jgi:hypothetical protein